MAKDHSKDQEWVRVIGPEGYAERPMKRKLAESHEARAMGVAIVGEGIPILPEHRNKGGRPTNESRRIAELERQLQEAQAALELKDKPKEYAAKA